ncbi:MAG: hypothetical protein ACR2PR_04325 [Pseudohongiellaceae bacterium]
MKGLTDDFIAIDTNVFRHIRSARNADNHITELLTSGISHGTVLLVDSENIITYEYGQVLIDENGRPQFNAEEDEDPAVMRLLSYWMNAAPKEVVNISTNANKELQSIIHDVIPLPKVGERKYSSTKVDRTFVYVAFAKDRVLISNDKTDIINRRDALISAVKSLNLGNADVITSECAHTRIQ